MNSLPTSIENYLREAGFSATELLVLNKLLEEEALTLRQIAAKTGKSTGMLDQAMKKLLRRNIVTKERMNDTLVYRLISLRSIVKWVEDDTRAKHEMLKRRHQNFEAFITSLNVDKAHPEMEFFDGEEGITKAYDKLLNHGKEMLHYFPVVCSAEDDPLRDFRVEYFRERRRRGIFARYIVHNTPLGRRFASRDAFEYRKTLLVPQDTYPISFEKVIVGDVLACINHAERRACFLHYRELAETERQLFERLWQEQESGVTITASTPATPKAPAIPLATRTLSGLREFFLSRKSIAIFALFALVAAGITYALYQQNVYLNTQRIRERAMSIAATGAMQFDAKDLDALRTNDDIKKPEYAKVIEILNRIREKNEGVRYAYIMRPSVEKGYWEFAADADSLNPFEQKDLNGDGVVDEQDQLNTPGERYSVFDPDIEEEMASTYSRDELWIDQWGTFLSASSPIYGASGRAVAIFSVDVLAETIGTLTQQSFSFTLYFLGLFLFFVFIRLAAFNKSLFQEVWQVFNIRKVLVSLALTAEIAFFITLGLYYYTLNIIKDEMGQKLLAIVAMAASEFDPADLAQLHLPRDLKTEAYQRVFTKLNEIRDDTEGVQWVYIFRPTEQQGMWVFLADADSNYYLPYWNDYNEDGEMNEDELNVAPGTYYSAPISTGLGSFEPLERPLIDDVFTDQWGTYISASAPIRNKESRSVAILGADMDIADVYQAAGQRYKVSLWFIGSFLMLAIVGAVVNSKNILKQ
ncbi:MAG: MarR family winged helix-turn-helix transcriptional regulator [Candidatus Peribacteraceae bacterium]